MVSGQAAGHAGTVPGPVEYVSDPVQFLAHGLDLRRQRLGHVVVLELRLDVGQMVAQPAQGLQPLVRRLRQRVGAHEGVLPRHEIAPADVHPRVQPHRDGRLERLPRRLQPGRVRPREGLGRSGAGAEEPAAARGGRRRLVAEIPHHLVQAAVAAALEFTDHVAARIEDRDGGVPGHGGAGGVGRAAVGGRTT